MQFKKILFTMEFNFLKEYESNWLAWRGRNLLFAQVAPISDFNFYLLFGQHFLEKKNYIHSSLLWEVAIFFYLKITPLMLII